MKTFSEGMRFYRSKAWNEDRSLLWIHKLHLQEHFRSYSDITDTAKVRTVPRALAGASGGSASTKASASRRLDGARVLAYDKRIHPAKLHWPGILLYRTMQYNRINARSSDLQYSNSRQMRISMSVKAGDIFPSW
jgi:hypothetical protein